MNTTQCPRPGLEPGPLDPESSALTMRPLNLPQKAKRENNYYKNNYILDSSTMNKSTISEDIVHKFASCGDEAENY